MREEGGAWTTSFSVFVIAVIQCGPGLLSSGCSPGDSNASVVEESPLGWGGPVVARETRRWSAASMDSASLWVVADTASFVGVPDMVDNPLYEGGRGQRLVGEGAFFPDGRIAVLYDLLPDSILLHLFDPESGDEALIPAPATNDGRYWHNARMVIHGGRVILMPAFRVGRRNGEDIWYADHEGRFTLPSSRVAARGKLVGALPDGSLVVGSPYWTTDAAGTARLSSLMSVRPRGPGEELSEPDKPEVIFTGALRMDDGDGDIPAAGAHDYTMTCAVAGDTIWVVPGERPELVAVQRSGDVALKIEWEAGDRTVPPGAREWDGAERFPAASDLKIGTDGLIYVQRMTVRGDQPVQGPEWLVFNPAGELVARLDVPGGLQVLGFGDGVMLATGSNREMRRFEVRVYELAESE